MSTDKKKKSDNAKNKRRQTEVKQKGNKKPLLVPLTIVIALVIVAGTAAFLVFSNHQTAPGNSGASTNSKKPIILYVNQENSPVDESNFGTLVNFAKAKGFNTIFFQISRSGVLLFSTDQLQYFVTTSHLEGERIFFVLAFSNASETLPSSQIYALKEDGIDLDMSTLPFRSQESLLSNLESQFTNGTTAVTTLNFTSTLKPDWLILETYGNGTQSYIHHGIIASVEVVATLTKSQYQESFDYALQNSDGVMVFDYYALQSRGY